MTINAASGATTQQIRFVGANFQPGNFAFVGKAPGIDNTLQVGVTSNNAIQFLTRNLERMTVTETGALNIRGMPGATTQQIRFVGANFQPGDFAFVGKAPGIDNALQVGVTSNNAMQLFTRNLERMRVTETGKVGIGTSSPSEKLEVDGNGKFNATVTATALTATPVVSVTQNGSGTAGLFTNTTGGKLLSGVSSGAEVFSVAGNGSTIDGVARTKLRLGSNEFFEDLGNFWINASPNDLEVFDLYVDRDAYITGNLNVTGDLTVLGASKSATVRLPEGRIVKLYAVESPEDWFEDFGGARLQRGVAWIPLEPTFAQTVNTSMSYHVFLTPNGNCQGLYVSRKTPTGFEVRELGDGTSNVAFDFRIVARRRGYEGVRLAEVQEVPREVSEEHMPQERRQLLLQPRKPRQLVPSASQP